MRPMSQCGVPNSRVEDAFTPEEMGVLTWLFCTKYFYAIH